MKAAFVAFGDLGQQLFHMLQNYEPIEKTAFFDDIAYSNGLENSHPFDDYTKDAFADYSFYIGLGYKHSIRKRSIITELKNLGRKVPSLVHPKTTLGNEVVIEDGVVVYAGCVLDYKVTLKEGVLLNNGVIISHESIIRESSYLSPSVTLSGRCDIGACSFLGTGTLVSNGITIGANACIGIGSVVTKNLSEGVHAIGNPLKILEKKLNII